MSASTSQSKTHDRKGKGSVRNLTRCCSLIPLEKKGLGELETAAQASASVPAGPWKEGPVALSAHTMGMCLGLAGSAAEEVSVQPGSPVQRW